MSDHAVQRWLEQSLGEHGQVSSALVLTGAGDSAEMAMHWPPDRGHDVDLLALARAAGDSGDGLSLRELQARGIVLREMKQHGRVVGTVALRLADIPPAVETSAPVKAASAADTAAAADLPQLMQRVLAAPGIDAAAAALATALATTWSCKRVCVGLTDHHAVLVRAVSHGAAVDTDQPWLRALGSAMDEAVDQAASVQYPQHPEDRPRITMQHAELCQRHGIARLLTVPMYVDAVAIGALAFEPLDGQRFDAAATARLEATAAALAPLLQLRQRAEQSAWQRWRLRRRLHTASLDAAELRLRRLGAAGAVLLVPVLLAWPRAYEISATTRLEGQVQRALVAPVDGFVKTVLVRPGDTVKAGQLLAELSDEDLRLDRRRWETEVSRHESTYAEAQAKADRTALVIADARAAEARAQLALVDQQLARSQVIAPFDALVLKGDLQQQLGAPIKRGDLLLTLAPSREFRVMLEIDERDVASVQTGATGAVTLSALADRSLPLVVDRVLPVARAEGGRNIFDAEARLTGVDAADSAALRPGLQGVSRLAAGERALGWQLSHRLVDWLRLQWWAWVG